MGRAVCSFLLCQEFDNHYLGKSRDVGAPDVGYNRHPRYAGVLSVLQPKGIHCSGRASGRKAPAS